MTYLEFYNLIESGGGNLTKRVQVAAVSWAVDTSLLPPESTDFEAKQAWAREIFSKPKSSAIKVLWFAVALTGIPGDGSTLTDAQLQGHVDNICNTNYAQAVLMPEMSGFFQSQ